MTPGRICVLSEAIYNAGRILEGSEARHLGCQSTPYRHPLAPATRYVDDVDVMADIDPSLSVKAARSGGGRG